MNENDTKPTPKTTEQLGDAIFDLYQNGRCSDDDTFSPVLSELLTSGRLELAMELLKLKQLERIADDVEEIRLTLEGTDKELASIAESVRYLPQGWK
jgi:hypothetical protein